MPANHRPASIDRYLVLGGSGAVGRYLLRRLAAEGADVLAPSRHPAPAWAGDWPSIRWLAGDLDRGLKAPPAVPFHVLSAGPLDALTRWLPVSGLTAGSRLVALSSMSAVWKQTSPHPAERQLAQRLLDAEQQLTTHAAAMQIELRLLRPTLIYGAGIDRSLTPLLRFAGRFGWLPWPSNGCGLRQPVHADDLAAAMLATPARGCALELPGGETLPFDRLLERLLHRLAPSAALLRVPLPSRLLRMLARGDSRLSKAAVPLYRSRFDQLADAADWDQLEIRPRPFEPTRSDFMNW